MLTRPLQVLAFGCFLLFNALNACGQEAGGKADDPTAPKRETSSLEDKRAARIARWRRSFKKIIDENFQNWDQDRDGRLSADEVDRLIFDPSISGSEAAAVASIHRYLRSDGAPPAVSQADLLTADEQPVLPEQGNGPGALRQDVNDGKPRFLTYYAIFSSHLKKAPRDLFTGEDGPTLEGIKQGALGDCFYMCVIGATVNRNPRTVRKMLRANADGTTDVRFPNGRTVRVPPLTDGEIALTSSAADQGIWINVLEKAFGELKYARQKKRHSEDDIDIDTISRGGLINSTIQMMTGHKAIFVPIRTRKNDKYYLPSRAEFPRIKARIESIFSKSFASNRLVCADIAPGVKGKDIPPGLVGHHAYAVLGYEQSSQTVTVWNPHGKDYTPKESPPGLQNGYPVKGGVFQLPLEEFMRIFNSVTYETSTRPGETPRRRG